MNSFGGGSARSSAHSSAVRFVETTPCPYHILPRVVSVWSPSSAYDLHSGLILVHPQGQRRTSWDSGGWCCSYQEWFTDHSYDLTTNCFWADPCSLHSLEKLMEKNHLIQLTEVRQREYALSLHAIWSAVCLFCPWMCMCSLDRASHRKLHIVRCNAARVYDNIQ